MNKQSKVDIIKFMLGFLLGFVLPIVILYGVWRVSI
jgi:hypothetical protein